MLKNIFSYNNYNMNNHTYITSEEVFRKYEIKNNFEKINITYIHNIFNDYQFFNYRTFYFKHFFQKYNKNIIYDINYDIYCIKEELYKYYFIANHKNICIYIFDFNNDDNIYMYIYGYINNDNVYSNKSFYQAKSYNYYNETVILDNQNNLYNMFIKIWSLINFHVCNKNSIIKNYITYNISFRNQIDYHKIINIIHYNNNFQDNFQDNNYNTLCKSTFINSDMLYDFIEFLDNTLYFQKK